jgi:transcriptional regulator with XRE-family HTH domain
MKEFKFIIEKTKTGYSGFSEEYPIFTSGRTIYELQKNALEATNLHLEDDVNSLTLENIAFEIDFKQFFEFYKVINAKHLAQRINMNESLLSQYVNGVKKPSKKQVDKIVDGLNDIGKELMELTLV